MLAGVHFDEIRHRAVHNSIIQIPERAAQDEAQGGAHEEVVLGAVVEQDGGDRDKNGGGETDQDDVAPGARRSDSRPKAMPGFSV